MESATVDNDDTRLTECPIDSVFQLLVTQTSPATDHCLSPGRSIDYPSLSYSLTYDV